MPEIERDVAPSAILPEAIKCVGKHIKKLGSLIEKFDGKITDNQLKLLGQSTHIILDVGDCRGMTCTSRNYYIPAPS